MSKSENRSAKELKLSQIKSYDDIITDALVDNAYYWTTIRKNRGRYTSCRGIREEDVTDILRNTVIDKKDVRTACSQLLQLPGLKGYYAKLANKDEQRHFHTHLVRYVTMYMPDCEFEISTTNRYTIDTQEAATVARVPISRGHNIKHLTGVIVPLTEEEEKDLGNIRRDFSIVKSSHKKLDCIFLGPARFANHDCQPNARLSSFNPGEIIIKAVHDIEVGEEITVWYGPEYFGPDNRECLCATCESMERNGWDPNRAPDSSSEADGEEGGREAHEDGESAAQATASSKTKASKKSEKGTEPTVLGNRRSSKKRRTGDIDTVKEEPPEEASRFREVGSSGTSRERSGSSARSRGSKPSSPPTSLSEALEAPNSSRTTNNRGSRAENDELVLEGITPDAESEAESDLSVLDDRFECDDNSKQIIRVRQTRGKRQKVVLQPPTGPPSQARNPQNVTSSQPDGVNPRKPKDYTLTKRLLPSTASRWVRCRTCDEDFVQSEPQTRRQCDRCERHFKLYRYQWPKTDKVDRFDTEERVKDYRCIDRFVWPEEERAIKKGAKTDTAETSKVFVDPERDADLYAKKMAKQQKIDEWNARGKYWRKANAYPDGSGSANAGKSKPSATKQKDHRAQSNARKRKRSERSEELVQSESENAEDEGDEESSDSEDDDEDEEEGEEEEEESKPARKPTKSKSRPSDVSQSEPPRKKRKYVRTGLYTREAKAARKEARRKAREEAGKIPRRPYSWQDFTAEGVRPDTHNPPFTRVREEFSPTLERSVQRVIPEDMDNGDKIGEIWVRYIHYRTNKCRWRRVAVNTVDWTSYEDEAPELTRRAKAGTDDNAEDDTFVSFNDAEDSGDEAADEDDEDEVMEDAEENEDSDDSDDGVEITKATARVDLDSDGNKSDAASETAAPVPQWRALNHSHPTAHASPVETTERKAVRPSDVETEDKDEARARRESGRLRRPTRKVSIIESRVETEQEDDDNEGQAAPTVEGTPPARRLSTRVRKPTRIAQRMEEDEQEGTGETKEQRTLPRTPLAKAHRPSLLAQEQNEKSGSERVSSESREDGLSPSKRHKSSRGARSSRGAADANATTAA